MAVIKKLDVYDFQREFRDMDRGGFSDEAYAVMYDYYSEFSEATENDYELDVIAVVGDWDEYDDLDKLISECDCLSGISQDTPENEKRKRVLEILETKTFVRELKNGNIFFVNF